MNWSLQRLLAFLTALVAAAAPLIWHFMHDYQRQRVITFLSPEQDPLGSGYHIIQSKIAIGSGGLFGKGWTNGSQAQLEFLPERDTDFIFAMMGEELGLLGVLALFLAGNNRLRGGLVWLILVDQLKAQLQPAPRGLRDRIFQRLAPFGPFTERFARIIPL